MHVLKFTIDGLDLYRAQAVSMDLYASDRVSAQAATVHRLDGLGAGICSQTVLGIAGLNASGKTTTLRALNFALDIARGNPMDADHLVYGPLVTLMNGLVSTRIVFTHADNWYLLESIIRTARTRTGQGDGTPYESGITLHFTEERLWRHTDKPVQKKELADFAVFKEHCEEILTRGVGGDHELAPEAKRYIPSYASITSGLYAEQEDATPVMNYIDSFRTPFSAPSVAPDIVHTFDRSVEKLTVDDDGKVHLKFVDDVRERVLGQFDAVQMLSAGTIRGSRIVNATVGVLREGGYFLVDEIENSLNKKLVETIMDLFASPVTNPRGATLVFTTHYPELLDHLERKDCVYFAVRDENRRIRLIKYSEGLAQAAPKKARVESKKSEIFFSNLVKGTAPKAKDVAAMRQYIKSMTGAHDAR
ncbi:AAA family ATPase [Bifidobacterium stellenboschense]|uniref:AAA domain protein n=1 Tax=Bifidobacterium stellenboschense TaxID=762211 RepID=A0A087DPX6_9BIFI|nr:AAA family ATPase [Bifidobacterium stellenboschense]KFI97576.1 AAA domain protein [Bifidobacterium stellenboschense]